MNLGRIAWIAAFCGLLAGIVLLSAPSEGRTGPDSADPQGTLALRRLLTSLGSTVDTGTDPPSGDGVFVLLTDLRSIDEDSQLLAWANGGGTLIVADPSSGVVGLAGASASPEIGVGTHALSPGCATPAASGVRRIVAGARDASLQGPPSSVGCFPFGNGDFMLEMPQGSGKVVLIGGSTPFENRYLASHDDAVWAAHLLAGSTVRFGTAVGAGTAPVRRGLWASLPPAARAVLVQLLIAVALYALFRARRVGRAVPEARLSPIPAGELVAATGRLLRAAKDPAYAATAIAAHATRDIDAPLGDISDTAASVHDDETLIAAAATIESAARRIREEGE